MSGLDDEVVKLGEAINKEKEIDLYLNYLKKETKSNGRQFHEELIHLAFVINYFTQEIRSDKEKQDIGKYLCSMNSNLLVEKCIGVLDTITKRYYLAEESYYLLLYSLCNRLVVIHYLGLHNFMLLYNVPPLLGKIECFVANCIDKSLNSYKDEPSFDKLKYSMTQIVTGYLILMFPIKKKVYVEFFIDQSTNQLLKMQLNIIIIKKFFRLQTITWNLMLLFQILMVMTKKNSSTSPMCLIKVHGKN